MATAMIQHRNNNRTVRAFGISWLFLGSLVLGGCAYMDGLKSLATPGDLISCRPQQHVHRATPCDPCYGFHPTCWHTWSEYCEEGLPPGEARPLNVATEGAGPDAPSAGRPADWEVLPTPPQEPRVIRLPPPPQEWPSTGKEPAAPPLPEDDLKAPLPGKTDALPKEDAKSGEPHARQGAKLRPGMACNDHRSRESGDLTELVALRRSISPPAPRASLRAISADASLAEGRPPRGEEAIFPRSSYYEASLDNSASDDPGVSAVALFLGRDLIDP